MMNLSRKVVASGMSLVLALGLTPLPAFAEGGGDLAAVSTGSSLTATAAISMYDCNVFWATTTTHVFDGNAFTPEPTVTYYGRQLVKGTDYTITYQQYNDDTDEYEDVTSPKEIGQYRVIVKGAGAYEGTKNKYFSITNGELNWNNVDINFDAMTHRFAFTGSAIQPTVTVKLGETTLTQGADYSLKYQKEEWDSETGDWVYKDVTPLEVDDYYVTITPMGKYATEGASEKREWFYIFNNKDLSYANVSWPNGSAIPYTGAELAPKPVVYIDGKELVFGTDYTIKYQQYNDDAGKFVDVTPKEIGKYRAYILGIGAYQSTTSSDNYTTESFSVYQGKSLSSDHASIDLPDGHRFAYTGSKIAPQPVVMYDGTVLTLGKDYTLSYESDNTYQPGYYEVTAYGMGDYRESIYTFYSIYSESTLGAAEITMPNDNSNYPYTGKPVTVKPSKVVLNGKTLVEGTDYTIAYYSSEGFKVDSPVQVGNYEMRLVGQGTYKGSYTSEDFSIVEQNNLSAALVTMPATMKYTGNVINPLIVVTMAGKKLTAGTDYTVNYYGIVKDSKNGRKKIDSLKDAGDYEAVIAPVGTAFVGTQTKSFEITPAALDSDDVSVTLEKNTLTYNGQNQNPTVVVTWNGATVDAANYDVSYALESSAMGTYSVTVTGRNNFTGTVTLPYQIGPGDTAITKLKAGEAAFTVTYNKVTENNSGYEVQYGLNEDMSGAKTQAITNVNTTSYTAKSLKPGKTYYVRVRTKTTANGDEIFGNWTATKSVTIPLTQPAKTKITKISAKGTSATVQWKKVTKNNKGYELRYSLKKNMKKAKTQTVNKAKTTKLTIKKLKAGKKYYVQVRTLNTDGNQTRYGKWSAKKTITVPPATPAATKITKIEGAEKAFTVNWKKVTKNNKGYQVRYSLNKNMKKAKTAAVNKAKTTKLTVKKLTAGKKYFVQVRTFNKAGKVKSFGKWSAKKSVTTKA